MEPRKSCYNQYIYSSDVAWPIIILGLICIRGWREAEADQWAQLYGYDGNETSGGKHDVVYTEINL